jgi:hypothetical protein
MQESGSIHRNLHALQVLKLFDIDFKKEGYGSTQTCHVTKQKII